MTDFRVGQRVMICQNQTNVGHNLTGDAKKLIGQHATVTEVNDADIGMQLDNRIAFSIGGKTHYWSHIYLYRRFVTTADWWE